MEGACALKLSLRWVLVTSGRSLQSVQAALRLWPDVFGSASAEQEKQRVLQEMHVVRPVIETGSVSVSRCLS